MNENLIAPEQRTAEWHLARSGKFTGSRFVDVLAKKGNGEPLKAYDDLINQLVVERLTGDFVDSGMDSYALKWGREVEPHAREAYQFETGDIVAESGFVNHKTLPFVGVSPDGLVKPKGGSEFKCPKNPSIHLARFIHGMDEKEFMPQVQGCIWVCECDWWDWVSFDPRMPQHLRFYRQRVYRDDKYIANMERSILLAEGEVRTRLESFTPERIEKILESRMTNKGANHGN
jgi:hypothetical protein